MHVTLPEEGYPGIADTAYGRLADITAELLGIQVDYEVDVSFMDLEGIREINRDYRGKDAPTDVISFAFLDDKDPRDRINPFEGDIMLGNIIICVDRAKEQAREIGQSPDRELCFLFVHGLLHLLGYDHMSKEDEERMFPLQARIMGAYEERYGKL